MSLRRQLDEHLPEFLPASPRDAIRGTELIRLVRMKLGDSYSDASLRYHFSIMSCDPSSVIAKVEKGHGYYRRAPEVPDLLKAKEWMAQGSLDELTGERREAYNLAVARMAKFHAVVRRYFEVRGRFPFPFRNTLANQSAMGNLWKIPDLAVVDFGPGEPADDGRSLELDEVGLRLRRTMGLSPFTISAVSLRLKPTGDLLREDFFRALSVGLWAQGAELIYAHQVEDEAVADEFRGLSTQFGIGVLTFGLGNEGLDELPSAEHLLHAQPREVEALMERIDVQRVAQTRMRRHIDWASLDALRHENRDFHDLFLWVTRSMETGQVKGVERD